ncbi:hypothetical protein Moror_729 [Moniliophthora roreri MCA 2997]|uniref:Uncharacterized protein n=1 Tax=Moniliophthora roreri (strain MCA 2997) TaxID=1381753 RepID=V2YE42_MONRO|nr:hypothetical protein Moror_729 [Moniliophthora roreri MCA 2997]KAI3614420.1 hypothetical protein WG66_009658 [Moniliophthora roreri]
MFVASNAYLYIVIALFCISSTLIFCRIRNPGPRLPRTEGLTPAHTRELVRPTWNEARMCEPRARRWEVKGAGVPLSVAMNAEIRQKGLESPSQLPERGEPLQVAVFVTMPFEGPLHEDGIVPVDLGVVSLELARD